MNKSQHYPFELSEDDHFSIIEKYFMERGPVYHQYEGYEYMVNHSIQKIFDECNSIEIDLKTSFYRATFGQIYFEKASIIFSTRRMFLEDNEAGAEAIQLPFQYTLQYILILK